ncbi:T9SS type A sorting domain-containing protein, partial [bacterium]|nr:T9SS type A sorting domain-containing protein [bacterium]
YSLIAVSMDGIRETIGTVSATPSANAATVTEYALHQNYPNPFNPETSISFDLAEAGMVKLTVFNPLGQTAATLVNGTMASGRHTIAFDGTNLTSGLYYYRMEAGDFTAVRKMILMK